TSTQAGQTNSRFMTPNATGTGLPGATIVPGDKPDEHGPPDAHADPATTVYIGRNYDPLQPRRVHTVLTTRRRDATYQALIRYEPVEALSSEIPGVGDVRQALASQGKILPQVIRRIDQETEMFIDNLGQPLHSIMSYTAYVNLDGYVVAYDLAQSSGGTPERL